MNLDDLRRELAQVGIRARRADRIVTEFEDHLASNPDASLGEPKAIARQFADELGTSLARRAAFRAFLCLAVAGGVFAASILRVSALGGVGRVNVAAPIVALVLACLLAGEIAFVAGCSALLRAFWLRGERVICAGEATVLVRRAGVGLFTGAVTMAALPVISLAGHHILSLAYALVAAGIGLVAIAVAVPAVRDAARLRPVEPGDAGDLFSDLGPFAPRGVSAWRFAILFAAGVALAITLAGVAADDPYDGLARGLANGLACLACFALLARYLGLTAVPSRG
jgi:hypothetical protein